MVRYHGAENCYLFVDEIHRFNKAQRILLLPDVESGEARLIERDHPQPTLLRHRPAPEPIPIVRTRSLCPRTKSKGIEPCAEG